MGASLPRQNVRDSRLSSEYVPVVRSKGFFYDSTASLNEYNGVGVLQFAELGDCVVVRLERSQECTLDSSVWRDETGSAVGIHGVICGVVDFSHNDS